MPIQINTAITSKQGFTVQSGSYCTLDIRINNRKNLNVDVRFYKDKAGFDNQAHPYVPDNAGLNDNFSKNLSNEEYAAFSNMAIHKFIQTYLETIFGAGTTQLVQ
jgi:hypothetical protein